MSGNRPNAVVHSLLRIAPLSLDHRQRAAAAVEATQKTLASGNPISAIWRPTASIRDRFSIPAEFGFSFPGPGRARRVLSRLKAIDRVVQFRPISHNPAPYRSTIGFLDL